MFEKHWPERRCLHDVQASGNNKFTKDRAHLQFLKDGAQMHIVILIGVLVLMTILPTNAEI